MKITTETLIKGYRMVDRIDLFENGRTRTLIPDSMNDELAGWRCFTDQESDKEIEIVGNHPADDVEEDYDIGKIAAKVDGTTLSIIIEWLENDRVSFITTTTPFTVFWQGEDKHSIFGTTGTRSRKALGD